MLFRSVSKKMGDHVNLGDVLCVLHSNSSEVVEVDKVIRTAFMFSAIQPEPTQYIYEIIE